MGKSISKHLILILTITSLISAMLIPLSVSAASGTRIRYLKAGQWADQSEISESISGNGNTTYYKIKVSKAGRLIFTFLNGSASFLITPSTDDCSAYISNGSSVVVDKGTYYLRLSSGKCKYIFKAATTQTNYCADKAKKLKAKKTAKMFFTSKNNFSRWYKITLSKKQKIRIEFNHSRDVVLYNAKGKAIDIHSSEPSYSLGYGRKYATSKKQPKGTYYIRVLSESPTYGGYYFGDYVTCKWY